MTLPPLPLAEDDPRWAAVVARDGTADGCFVYAVRSTGIYCRPSCPARRPKAVNVIFYADAASAEAAGFRPCKRCQPDAAPRAAQHAAQVAALCRWIDAAPRPPTLEELAKQAGMSPYHLHRVFKAVTGLTPRAYAEAQRAQRVRQALEGGAAVTDALYTAGYASASRFYDQADRILGMSPGAYRRGGAQQTIRFAIGQCALGAILVAQSARGLCAILLGAAPQALMDDLRARFPAADLLEGDAAFAQVVAQVVAFVEAPRLGLDLPLDLRGTAFQQRVWRALQAIAPGTTQTYSELAHRIGAPRAVRAVASACAANPLAVAIPCHRVVRADGSLAGYRWGLARKQALLKREQDD